MIADLPDPTTGLEAFDDLIDGVRIGDNLVYRSRNGADVSPFVRAFIEAADGRTVVHVRIQQRDRVLSERSSVDLVTLDWREVGADADATLSSKIDALSLVDRELGEGTLYVFDDLTAMQELWGPERALRFFSWACPRLYRHRTIALWTLDADSHSTTFHRSLGDITQVILEISRVEDGLQAEVLEADGRPTDVVGRRAEMVGTEGVGWRPLPPRRQHVGELIRSVRTARGITQAELARRAGMTSSALSQVERGTSGLSGDSLTRIWELLGVPFGPAPRAAGYRITRRASHRPERLAEGVRGTPLLRGSEHSAMWKVAVAPSSSGSGPLLATKGTELVTVLSGAFTIELDGEPHTLQEADSVEIDHSVVTGWANPGVSDCEILWVQFRPGSSTRSCSSGSDGRP